MRITGLLLLAMAAGQGSTTEPQPGETVKAFYETANRGAFVEAQQYFTKEAVEGITRTLGSFQAYCDDKTKKRTMTSIQIVSQGVRGDEATVKFRVEFANGLSIGTETLTKEGGAWRISWAPRSRTSTDWRALAEVAQEQRHLADAWAFYRMAAKLTPSDPELQAGMQRLWREMGGTEEGMKALVAAER